MKHALRRHLQSDGVTNVVGLAFAAGLQVALLPAISRLFTPEQFGTFGGIYALAALISTFAAGRFENAIIGAETDEDANCIDVLGSLLAICSGLILFLAALGYAAVARDARSLDLWLSGLGIVVSVSLFQVQVNSAVRLGEFKAVAVGRITTATAQAALTVAAGLAGWGAVGLVAAIGFGQAAGVTVLYAATRKHVQRRNFTAGRLIQIAKKYRRYPLMDAPATIANSLATSLPTFFFIAAFGAVSTGYLTMLMRLWAGTGILSRGMGEVFRARARKEYQATGQFRQSFRSTLRPLGAFGLIIAVPLMLYGPTLFEIALGPEWRTAGQYAAILAPSLSIQLVASTMSSSFYVSNNLVPLVIWQGLLLVTQFLVLTIATRLGDEFSTLLCLSGSGIALYSLYLYLSRRTANGTQG